MTAIKFENVSKRYRIGKSAWPTLRDRFDSTLQNVKNIVTGSKHQGNSDPYFWALRNVSFEALEGEALAIIGPNGSGKSTILKILASVTKPFSGRVSVNGSVAAMIELGAGLHPELTGRENIYLYGAIMGMKRQKIGEKVDEIIDFSELSEFIDTPLKRYSSGMQARLGFAVTAHIETEIMLVDEVLSVGDFVFQEKCVGKMEKYKNEGVTIIFVSHNLESVRRLCPKAVLLNNGAVEEIGPTGKVIQRYYQVMSQNKLALSEISTETCETSNTYVAKIVKVELLDHNGEESNEFKPGDTAKLKVEIKCFQNIKNPIVGFFIRREDRLMVFDTTSIKMGYPLPNVQAGTVIKLEFIFRVNLLKGTYYIGNHIAIPNSYFDYLDPSINFYVDESYSWGGIADLSPKFKAEYKMEG
ncbi:MAG: ABC transporter ATP-binding protein [Bacteroidetes bacterium]|nr:ABC transporter ATP-binding protein [Bacteroidota bacterium]